MGSKGCDNCSILQAQLDRWQDRQIECEEILALVAQLVEQLPRPTVRRQAAESVLRSVADRYRIDWRELYGRGRQRHLAGARAEASEALHAAGWSSTAIGDALGRDHSTILHMLLRKSAEQISGLH